MAIDPDPVPVDPPAGASGNNVAGGAGRAAMSPRFLFPATLALWSLFVWGGRLRNVRADLVDGGSVGWFPLVAAPTFVLLGFGVLAGLAVGRIRPTGRPRFLGPVLTALAVLSIGVWVVRGIDIALGEHSLGFIVVHTVLALVSIGLGAAVLRPRRQGPGS